MKSLKFKAAFLLLGLILFNSCIVKSLFPFFTTDTIHFEKQLLGIWRSNEDDDSRWIIMST